MSRLLFESSRHEYIADVIKNADEQAWLEQTNEVDDEESPPESYTDSWEESLVVDSDVYDRNHESIIGNATDFTFVAHGDKVSLYQQHYD